MYIILSKGKDVLLTDFRNYLLSDENIKNNMNSFELNCINTQLN